MKTYVLILVLFFGFNPLWAQVAVNTDGSPADSSAMLHVKSNSKGFLPPRMTLAQLSAIQNPPPGLIVFCTTDRKYYVYTSTSNQWKEILYGSETIPSQAQFFLGNGGLCNGTLINGSCFAGSPVTGSVLVTIMIQVYLPGIYFIYTNTVNGISFQGSGLFPAQGVFPVVLTGAGTPVTAQISHFSVYGAIGIGSCSFDINVSSCGSTVTDPRDSKVYNTVLIGSQCWMRENLNTGIMVPGTQEQTNNGIIEKSCYANLDFICSIYGGLYSWWEMMNYTTSGNSNPIASQGICPAGWHIPSNAEWSQLSDYLGGTTLAGGKMKETGTVHWASPNTNATNSSLFTGLPGGQCNSNFYDFTYKAYLWSSTEESSGGSSAWYRVLNYDNENLDRLNTVKNLRFSARCMKNNPGTAYLTTTTVTNIASTTAVSGGTVIDDGGSAVTARGVCWSTYPSPTTDGSHTTDGTGSGTFTSNLTGLIPSTIYYLRAYATNSYGTAYGNEIWFTSAFACGYPFTDTRDYKVYNTVFTGNQCWMKENINIGTRIDGSVAQTNNGTIEKYCYNNLESNCTIYGGLYTAYEAVQYTQYSIQGICPSGWRLSTNADWAQLITSLGGESVAGGKMKETGFVHWTSPNTGADNSSGFTALPGGYWAYSNGSFSNLTNEANFWSCSYCYSQYASSYNLGYNAGTISFCELCAPGSGYSVRCVQIQ